MKLRPFKHVLGIVATIAILASCQQNKQSFILTGQLEGIQDGKAILTQGFEEGAEADSATITDGKFVFERNFSEPIQVVLTVEDHDLPLYFYAENAEMV